MYVANGVFTEKRAIDKAIEDFEKRGLHCIEYANGSYHDIADYADMAIKTASQRAQLMGEGEFRKRIGNSLIIISKHGGTCPLCAKWEGKILIDDVYSGGTRADGNYPLLSEAMAAGLYHPRCRHGCGTYYPELEDVFDNSEASQKFRENELQNQDNSDTIQENKRSAPKQSNTNHKLSSSVNKKNKSETVPEYRKGIESFDKNIQDKIRRDETIISGNNYETALVYDKNGKRIMQKRGGNQEVNFNRNEFAKLKDCVVTHNHPNGNCFSIEDIDSLVRSGASELRACNRKVCYSMKAPKQWNKSVKSYDIKKLQQMYSEYDLEISKSYLDIATKEGKHILYYDKQIQEEIISRISEDIGFKFEIEVK